MKELWTALVELLTPPCEWGDTKCFTNVVAWAESPEDYTSTITRIFEKYGWYVLEVEDCERVSERGDIAEELAELIERAKSHPEDCIHGTLDYYPSRRA